MITSGPLISFWSLNKTRLEDSATLLEKCKIDPDNKEVKTVKVGNMLYFINKYHGNTLYVYNLKTGSAYTFDLPDRFFEVTDLFVYDVNKDNDPEIFVFSIGELPREDVRHVTIFSLGTILGTN